MFKWSYFDANELNLHTSQLDVDARNVTRYIQTFRPTTATYSLGLEKYFIQRNLELSED